MEKVPSWVSLVIAFLLCVTIVVPMATEAATPDGIPCNEFRPNDMYGVLTGDCSHGDDIADGLLSDAGVIGVMGPYNRTNDTVSGRFTNFVLNDENKSIDSYATWSNGALYQVFDTIMFYDATSMTSSIMGPIFNGTVDSANIRIQNHPAGIITITSERSVRIKLTMAGGIDSRPVADGLLNKSFADAMYVGSENISSIVMVKQGSLMMAGERSIIVDLAKGGKMMFRAAPDTSDEQSRLLDGILQGSVLTEYWIVTRDDGAIYSTVAYNSVDFASSNNSLQLGSWTLKLPQQMPGRVVLIHMDKMSFSISGEDADLFSLNASQPREVNDIAQVLAATRNGSDAPLFFREVAGTGVHLTLYVSGNSTGTEPIDTGDEGTDSGTQLNIPVSWFIVGGIIAIGAVAGAALLLRRSRRK